MEIVWILHEYIAKNASGETPWISRLQKTGLGFEYV